jgi:hypothetical protein
MLDALGSYLLRTYGLFSSPLWFSNPPNFPSVISKRTSTGDKVPDIRVDHASPSRMKF